MTFVTVGNATQEFSRLLNGVEDMAQRGEIEGSSLTIQYGNNPHFQSSSCRIVRFFSVDEFERLFREADLIICHAGAGTLIHALRLGKIPVVMPRQKRYREHVDDHQLDLVRR